ncbi:hypothetical protein GKIL_1967 [Gloeobacter kilaueensis JS1]|uniref:Uncharacterized protein n=1 Tax=Gloeobacter kilaueensis (strain ATCC BAA-2537 / CCAP 1431/1 / ULC 316 / JS1) TaxID=1183438 RepID=U5QH46_GLOK1|nr:hypothetical protein GKIL_1967 [Gloeobacter kilaueensis JS1]
MFQSLCRDGGRFDGTRIPSSILFSLFQSLCRDGGRFDLLQQLGWKRAQWFQSLCRDGGRFDNYPRRRTVPTSGFNPFAGMVVVSILDQRIAQVEQAGFNPFAGMVVVSICELCARQRWQRVSIPLQGWWSFRWKPATASSVSPARFNPFAGMVVVSIAFLLLLVCCAKFQSLCRDGGRFDLVALMPITADLQFQSLCRDGGRFDGTGSHSSAGLIVFQSLCRDGGRFDRALGAARNVRCPRFNPFAGMVVVSMCPICHGGDRRDRCFSVNLVSIPLQGWWSFRCLEEQFIYGPLRVSIPLQGWWSFRSIKETATGKAAAGFNPFAGMVVVSILSAVAGVLKLYVSIPLQGWWSFRSSAKKPGVLGPTVSIPLQGWWSFRFLPYQGRLIRSYYVSIPLQGWWSFRYPGLSAAARNRWLFQSLCRDGGRFDEKRQSIVRADAAVSIPLQGWWSFRCAVGGRGGLFTGFQSLCRDGGRFDSAAAAAWARAWPTSFNPFAGMVVVSICTTIRKLIFLRGFNPFAGMVVVSIFIPAIRSH